MPCFGELSQGKPCRYNRGVVPEIDVRSLRAALDAPNPPTVIDVREADELAVSRLPDAIVHLPLATLPTALGRLDPGGSYVVVCRVGGRSAQATAFLLGQGFANVRNVVGGMNAYAREVDSSLLEY